MDEKREIRNTSFQVQVTGENEEKRTVEGYALLFDIPSDGLSLLKSLSVVLLTEYWRKVMFLLY